MSDVMCIVSKAVFEKQSPGADVGSVLGLDRYLSTHKSLEVLAAGGTLFLVTVRLEENYWPGLLSWRGIKHEPLTSILDTITLDSKVESPEEVAAVVLAPENRRIRRIQKVAVSQGLDAALGSAFRREKTALVRV